MTERRCPKGKMWDNLLRTCINMGAIPPLKLHQPIEPVLTVGDPLTAKTSLAKSTGPPDVLVLSQTLWISVILVTLGSIFALTLWFFIFRRQIKARGENEDPVPEQEVLQKNGPTVKFHPFHSDNDGQTLQRTANGSSPFQPLHQTNPKWENGFSVCREPARFGGTEGSGALQGCSTVVDHRLPLPATELGGTALVTTKTCRVV